MTARRHMTAAQKIIGAALGLAALGTGLWLVTVHPHRPAPHLVYTSSGYGGFIPAPSHEHQRTADQALPAPTPPAPASSAPPASAAQAAVADYAAGRYPAAERAAGQVVRVADQHPTLPNRRAAARARSLLAYAAARQHHLALARIRFAAAEQAAATLPGEGRQRTQMGEDPQPTLTEDAAYQHAVCTAALGDKAGADAEYRAFMRRFPDSPLVMAAVKRIAWLHGGNVPPQDQAAWRQAMAVAQKEQQAQARAASLCGPECLAELLRRQGQPARVAALANAMHTSDQGTTLAALATEAQRHGFRPQGLALTLTGLQQQSLPVIALVQPGHYVLVDKVTPMQVTIWDPDGHGVGHPLVRALSAAAWTQQWQGITLALHPAPLQTAER